MAEARGRAEWGRTSSVLAMIHNANAKTPKAPAEFDPYTRRGPTRRRGLGLEGLAALMR